MILKRYVKHILAEQDLILQSWAINDKVKKIFASYAIDNIYFLKSHAGLMIEFYVETIKNGNIEKKYYQINSLLTFLKKNEIKDFEFFIILNCFKNDLIKFLEKKDLDKYETVKEVNNIFEEEFPFLLKQYSKIDNKIENKLKHFYTLVNKYIIMSSTDVKGKITQVTDAFCEISGYSRDELIGQSHSIVRHPKMEKIIYKQMWDTIQKGGIWQGEIKNVKKDGGFYWVDAKILPTFNAAHEIVGYNAVRQDITAQKNLEEQQDMLTQQSKSAAMGEMISMIAHQWRQPLQTISILVQKLPLTRMLGNEITDELLEDILHDVNIQIDYMTNTIDDFRNFFKPNKEKNKIELKKLVSKSIEFLSYMLNIDSITVNVEIEENVVVHVYVNEIIQVLINIVKNARDVMIEKDIKNRNINIKIYATKSYSVIEVEDNAGGIPGGIIEKIFEPYFSTKSDEKGTGLGLYMSKTIIEQHSLGKLSVSNSNLGAVFKIELPL